MPEKKNEGLGTVGVPSFAAPNTGNVGVADGRLHVWFVNVGQGDCTVVRCPNGRTVLIDCGSVRDFDQAHVWSTISDILDGGAIDLMVMTHPDQDHYNKFGIVGGTFVRRIVHSAALPNYRVYAFRHWVWTQSNVDWSQVQEITVNAANPGPMHLLDGGQATNGAQCTVEALASNVPADGFPAAYKINTASVVVRITLGDLHILVGADATVTTEDFLMTAYGAGIRSEVLRVPHHGSETSSGLPFLQAVQPNVAVVSVARVCDNPMLPREDVITRYEAEVREGADAHPVGFWRMSSWPPTWQEPNSTKQLWETGIDGSFGYTWP